MLAKVRGNGDEGIVSGCFLRAFKTGYSSARGSQKGASILPEIVTSHVFMSVKKKDHLENGCWQTDCGD